MSSKQENRGKYRLWRVNVDGAIVTGRWRTAFGAINGAFSKLYPARDARGAEMSNVGPAFPDVTDMAIHVECIGEPLEKAPEDTLLGRVLIAELEGMDVSDRCAWTTPDGRQCQREAGHSERKPHHADGVEGQACTCMLRWHPNRCKAHPEHNG